MKSIVRFILLVPTVLIAVWIAWTSVGVIYQLIFSYVRVFQGDGAQLPFMFTWNSGGQDFLGQSPDTRIVPSLLFINASIFLLLIQFHVMFSTVGIMMLGLRISNTWKEIFFYSFVWLIVLVIVIIASSTALRFLFEILQIAVLLVWQINSLFSIILLGCMAAYLAWIDWHALNITLSRIWYVFSGIWNEQARLDFLRSLPNRLRPQSLLRVTRSWNNRAQTSTNNSNPSTPSHKDLKGLNDPLTGSPIDPAKEISRCAQCGSYYHSTSIPDLQSMNQGQCVTCRGTNFQPVSVTA